jgi:hypothetical protein
MNLLRPTFHIISHIRDIVKLVRCDNCIQTAQARAALLSGQWQTLTARREHLSLSFAAQEQTFRAPGRMTTLRYRRLRTWPRGKLSICPTCFSCGKIRGRGSAGLVLGGIETFTMRGEG